MSDMTVMEKEPLVPETKWKQGAPPDRVLAATNGSAWYLIEYIGQAITHLCEEAGEEIESYLPKLDPGVWIIELKFFTSKLWIDYGWDYELDSHVVSYRAATDEEMEAGRSHEWPWDPSLWIEKEPDTGEVGPDL